MALIGVDVGGTGVKALAFSVTGEILSSAYQEYDMYSDGPGHFEMVPDKLAKATFQVLKEAAAACPERIDGIGVSSFAETFICFDKDGKILSNGIMYLDNRGQHLVPKLLEHISREEIIGYSGAAPRNIQSLLRMMLMQEIWPGVLEKTGTMGHAPVLSLYNRLERTHDKSILSAGSARFSACSNSAAYLSLSSMKSWAK